MSKLGIAILISIFVESIFSQENAGTSLSPSLQECYNNTFLIVRDNRLPATMTTLIELIRRIEDKNPSVNARELSIQILQRFRQDGIMKSFQDIDASFGLPYSPKRWESYKFRVQLKKLTPGNAITFNNDSLNALERCSLHSMISSTIEMNERGDEGIVCNRISRYTSRIHKRQAEFSERFTDQNILTRSDCPIESGVVYTKWGAVKAGLVIAGIASGFEYINVPTPNGTVDNRYASTIAGELSEAALYQGKNDIKIGVKGGWNTTIVPKVYFLQEVDKLHVTDAEIRGGLDGLYMALNIDSWNSRINNIKISQILDLYYSPRGVLNNTIRACNRKLLQTGIVPRITEKLILETTRFNFLLDDESVASYSPSKSAFGTLAEHSVSSFNNYISYLNDLECSAEDSVVERVSTDVVIILDTAWEYQDVGPFVSFILENIDVNKYETSYTVLNGQNFDTIVNKSTSILDFYKTYNLTEHQRQSSGFDYTRAVAIVEDIYRTKLDNETELTGQSTIVLFLPHNSPTSEQKRYVQDRKDEVLKGYLPDLRILVAGVSSKENYADFVTNPNNDVFTLVDNSDDNTIKSAAKSVVDRIKKIPRNVVNPKCGSSLKTSESNTFDLTQYVEPQGVNYHRIAPNYFYDGNSENRHLKIRGQGYGTLSVCMSRTETNPRNSTSDDSCKNIISDEISFDIDDYCKDHSVLSCAPIYLSVEGLVSNVRCKENTCRFPDSIKYIITMENVGCAGGSERLISSFTLVLFVLFTIIKF